jgi:DNA-binding GntR family transcriptional regulator
MKTDPDTPQAPAPGAERDDGRALSEVAYDALESMIVTGRLPPGMLLSESELARRLGCGRTPVREALQRLSYEGYVDILPRRGVLVAPFDVTQQFALLELRRPMEELMVRLAARRATPAQRAAMLATAEAFEAAAAASDFDGYVRSNRRAVHLEAEAAGNPMLRRHMGMIHGLARRYWYGQISAPELFAGAARCHCAVLRAVASGDEDAAAAAAHALLDFLAAVTRSTLERHIGAGDGGRGAVPGLPGRARAAADGGAQQEGGRDFSVS